MMKRMIGFKEWGLCVYCVLLTVACCVCGGNTKVLGQAVVNTGWEYRAYKARELDTMAIIRLMRSQEGIQYYDRTLGTSQLDSILKVSKAAGFRRGAFFALLSLGNEYQIAGNYQKALEHLLQVVPYLAYDRNRVRANIVYNNIGLTYSSLGNYKQALAYYYKSLEAMADKAFSVENGTDSSGVYNNIAVVWARQHEMSHAIDLLKIARNISYRKQDSIRLSLTFNNLGSMYEIKEDLTLAKTYYDSALAIEQRLHRGPVDHILILTGLASVAKQQQQYKAAIAYLNTAVALEKKGRPSAYASIGILFELGDLYARLHDYRRAEEVLVRAYNRSKAAGHQGYQQQISPRIAQSYAASGKYELAYKYLNDYSLTNDSLAKVEKAKSFAVQTESQLALKDKQMLVKELFIARQQHEIQQKNLWIGATAVGSLLLLITGLALIRNYRHAQSAQQAVIRGMQQTQEINQLKAQMRGEEKERERIAHELHNGISSQLFGIRIQVDSVQQRYKVDNTLDHQLQLIYEQITEASQDVRKTAHNLMPDLLLDEGLGAAIAHLCEKVERTGALHVDFQEYGLPPLINKEIELSIYRMVQELIQNVLKHAVGATNMLVQISFQQSVLSITVEDNGQGLLPGNIRNDGMGIRQIKRRTQALKGQFEIDSTSGEGTTAYLEFEVQHLL